MTLRPVVAFPVGLLAQMSARDVKVYVGLLAVCDLKVHPGRYVCEVNVGALAGLVGLPVATTQRVLDGFVDRGVIEPLTRVRATPGTTGYRVRCQEISLAAACDE